MNRQLNMRRHAYHPKSLMAQPLYGGAQSAINNLQQVGFRPDLALLQNIIYFQHRQIRLTARDQDTQFAYRQIVSCMVADVVLFNCCYSREIYLSNVRELQNTGMGFWQPGLDQIIRRKSRILYPINIPIIMQAPEGPWGRTKSALCIVWPQLWAVNRNPRPFFRAIQRLENKGYQFKIYVLGEHFYENPHAFRKMKKTLNITKLHNYGYLNSVQEYLFMLKAADVVLTLTINEYCGVVVVDGVFYWCVPDVPSLRAFREMYATRVNAFYCPDENLYGTLANLCRQKMMGSLCHYHRRLASAHSAVSRPGSATSYALSRE